MTCPSSARRAPGGIWNFSEPQAWYSPLTASACFAASSAPSAWGATLLLPRVSAGGAGRAEGAEGAEDEPAKVEDAEGTSARASWRVELVARDIAVGGGELGGVKEGGRERRERQCRESSTQRELTRWPSKRTAIAPSAVAPWWVADGGLNVEVRA